MKTQSVVDCKIKNTKIEIVLDPEFSAALSEWKLTIDDGSGTVLDFSSTTTKRLVYWFFGEEVDKLSLNIRGKLLEGGNTITENMTLTKSQATEKYDDVSEFFEGGEALKINVEADRGGERFRILGCGCEYLVYEPYGRGGDRCRISGRGGRGTGGAG